ncbi:siderophore-interacting protein [Kluyvera intermedia]|uniref:siderophore-interacting protein n=1 Tax=Kluyvera intermedia TaxID=61648 RepID=UPI000786C5C2|nr:siderophore-interacting protein [Kluyvera intermedia]WQD30351.1 siderophore-interacting protein [Kluyvera intermedia]VDZ86313.1 NADPH-dependent ferric-chelate reductase [Kluyvera intermedia]
MKETKYPQRVRNELRFRELTVTRVERIGEAFQRIVLGGETLEGFSSRGFDDHTKLFFPQAGTTLTPPTVSDDGIVWAEGIRPQARDYTPLYNAERHELTYDFFIHDGGVASLWAMEAKVGDTLLIGGPRGSLVVPEDYAWQLYVCDETGMPALRRRLEALSLLPQFPQVTALVMVRDVADKAYLAGFEGCNIEWFSHDGHDAVAARLAQFTVPESDYFIWLTGEGKVVKNLTDGFVTDAIDPQLVRSSAYWHAK